MAPLARPVPTEDQVQRGILAYLANALPPEAFCTAVNPVPGKTPAAAGRSKALGMVAGVPDLLIVYDGRALFIEVKRPGGRLSEAQGRVHALLWKAGAAVAVCSSVEDVEHVVREWGIRRNRVSSTTPPAAWPARSVA